MRVAGAQLLNRLDFLLRSFPGARLLGKIQTTSVSGWNQTLIGVEECHRNDNLRDLPYIMLENKTESLSCSPLAAEAIRCMLISMRCNSSRILRALTSLKPFPPKFRIIATEILSHRNCLCFLFEPGKCIERETKNASVFLEQRTVTS